MSHFESLFGFGGLLFEVAWKSSIILGVASLLHLVLRKRFPLAVSFGWNAVLVALAMLPLATNIAPWRLEYESVQPLVSETDSPSIAAAAPLENASPRNLEPVEVAAVVKGTATQVPPASIDSISWWHAVGVIYLSGFAICALRLFLSVRRLRQLLRGSWEVDESQWNSAVSRWRAQLGIRRPVRVRTSPSVAVPFTTGIFRPVLMLPEQMPQSADRDQCDVVALHELTHVARFDCFWQFALKLLQVVYWWQPLIWLSERQIVEGRERVCDLFCVGRLNDRQLYADALLSIVQTISRPVDLDIGQAMARVPRIAPRLDDIATAPELKTSRPTLPVSAMLMFVAVLVTTVLAAGVEVMAKSPEAAAAKSSESTVASPTRTPTAERAARLDESKLQPSEQEKPALAAIDKLIGKQYSLNKNGTAVTAVFGGHEMTPSLLENLSKLTNLSTLYLHKTKITDAGMENLRTLSRLRKLYVGHTSIGNAGIAHLKGLKQPEYLDLAETKVSDNGLANFNELSNLRILSLVKTPVTDKGLKHLRGLRNLELLTLAQTKVTDEGVRLLQKALPNLVIIGKPEWTVENPRDAKQLSVSIAVPKSDSTRLIDLREPGSHFNVVVANRMNRELHVWETWNSWGYYNLFFEVLDDQGKVQYTITKKPRAWTRNFASWIAIKPGEHLTLPVDFNQDIWVVAGADGRSKRSLERLLAKFADSPKFKLNLRAVFRVYPDAETIDRTIWTGTVRSTADMFEIQHSPK